MSSQQQQPPPPPPLPPQQLQQQPANDSAPSPSKRQRVNSVVGENNISGENNNNDQGGEDDGYNFDSEEGLDWEASYVERSHCLQVNLFGVHCTSDKCKDNPTLKRRGPNLWSPSHKMLTSHWKGNKCYPFEMPNARKTEKELTAKQIQLHNQLQQSPQPVVDKLIADEFPSNCKVLGGKYFYCLNCGYFTNRKNDMQAHFGKKIRLMKCILSQHLRDSGEVLEGIHGIKCPRAVVELVRQKQFKLPYPHFSENNQPAPTPTRTTTASIPASRRHYNSPTSLLLASNLDRGIVTATPEEMRKATALAPSRIDNNEILQHLKEACFTDQSMDLAAKREAFSKVEQHKILLLPVIESGLVHFFRGAESCNKSWYKTYVQHTYEFLRRAT